MRGARALLFDLDGVLIESYEVWFRVMNSVAEELGYPPVTRGQFADAWGQGIEEDQRLFYTRHTIAELERAFDAHFPRHLAHLRVASGVGEVFAVLAARGIPSAVITNTPRPTADSLVERAGAAPDLVVGGTCVERPKPAPDMVLHACERLSVPVASAWVVGDSRFDRDAARAAGAHFLGFQMDGELRVESLDELASLLQVPA